MGIGLDASEFGQTPMDPDQLTGLKIPMLHTHAQINAYEQANINEALRWLMQYLCALVYDSYGVKRFACRRSILDSPSNFFSRGNCHSF